MKTVINLSLGVIMLIITATCNNPQENTLEISGTIEEQGITTYQYGTHRITSNEQFYALKSEKVDLDQYVGKEVTITAEKIEGYPVDGGPEYLLVLEIR